MIPLSGTSALRAALYRTSSRRMSKKDRTFLRAIGCKSSGIDWTQLADDARELLWDLYLEFGELFGSLENFCVFGVSRCKFFGDGRGRDDMLPVYLQHVDGKFWLQIGD